MKELLSFLCNAFMIQLFLCPVPLFSDQIPSTPDGAARYLADQYGIPINSKFYARFNQEVRATKEDFDESGSPLSEDSSTSPEITTESNVIVHLKGDQGTPIPSEDKEFLLKQSQRPIKQMDAKSFKPLLDTAMGLTNLSSARLFRGKRLEACSEDSSVKTEIGLEQKELKKAAIIDTLFIDQKDLPPNAKSIFGENVDIRSYSPKIGNRAYHASYGFGVTCLPTRIIITGGYSIRYTGAPALRNYDQNPNGKGKLAKTR